MANNWVKLVVYNGDTFIGSFYDDIWSKEDAVKAINEKYGSGNWTRYNIGN